MMLILLLAVAAFALPTFEKSMELQFRDFQKTFGKKYVPGTSEYSQRLKIFSANVAEASRMNALSNGEGAVFGITKFMDITPEEFQATYLNYNKTEPRQGDAEVLDFGEYVPESTKDWRNSAAVTAVKDQGVCGSCWAHATVESVESQCALEGQGLREFSVQQVVSCDTTDAGCNGGDTVSGFAFVQKNGGLATQSAYPYTSGHFGQTGSCQNKPVSGGRISGYTWATNECYYGGCNNQNEKAVIQAVSSKGPPAICVNAAKWQTYTSGVMTDAQCGGHGGRDLDHCVQLVGYGSKNGKDYWLVRNSWNTDWGYGGYIWLNMGENTCGVLDEVNFATCT